MNLFRSQQSKHLIAFQAQLLQQQKNLHLENLINAYDNPQIKKLQQYNKNKVERELLNIATNFYSFIDKIEMVKWFFIDYRKTLQTYKKEEQQLQKLSLPIQVQKEEMVEEQVQKLSFFSIDRMNSKPLSKAIISNNFSEQMIQSEIQKPLIALPAKRLQSKNHQIQSVVNKLKVMVIKVNTKQSSSFEHVHETYISRLKYTLSNSNLDEKRFKMYKIKNILNYLPKKYSLLKLESRNIYPYHPTRYPNPEIIGFQYNESPMFFINFFVQQLLFFNQEPMKLPNNFSELLYCPIILIKGKAQQSLKISAWYYEQLNLIEPLWRSMMLLIKVFSKETSLEHPIYYSHIFQRKLEFFSELKDSNEIGHNFHFMEHKYAEEQKLESDLEAIKQFIYQKLIFNHLHKLLAKSFNTGKSFEYSKQQRTLFMDFSGGFRIQFQLVTDAGIKEKFKNILHSQGKKFDEKSIGCLFSQKPWPDSMIDPIYKSELISDLLTFYKRKDLFTIQRSTIQQQLQTLFKSTLVKILADDLDYRLVTPLYSGSMALYYYAKKSSRKNSVKEFLQNFDRR